MKQCILGAFMLIVLSCFLGRPEIKAQKSSSLDSVLLEIKSIPSKELKVDSLNKIAQKLWISNPYLSKKVADEALRLSKSDDYKAGTADALRNIGVLLRRKDKLRESLKYLEESYSLFQEVEDHEKILELEGGMSTIYRTLGNNERSMELLLEGTRRARDHKPKELLRLNASIGDILFVQGKMTEAKKYYLDALDATKYTPIGQDIDSTLVANIINSIGETHGYLGDFEEGERYLKMAERYAATHSNGVNLPYVFESLGTLYNQKGESDKALDYMKKAEKLFELKDRPRSMASIHASLGETYNLLNDHRQALLHLNKAISYAEEAEHLEFQEQIEKKLAETYEKLGKSKLALEHLQLYIDISEKILNEKTLRAVEDMKAQYQTESQKKQIEILQKDKEITLAQASLRTTQLYGALGGLVFILFFSFVIVVLYERRRRDQQLILAQNEEIMDHQDEILRQKDELIDTQEELHQQKIIEHEQKKELEVNRAWIEGEERERERLAGELHDQVGSMLSTVKLHLQALESKIDKLNTDSINQFKFTNNLLDKACQTVRNLSHEVSSGMVNRYGLVTALEELRENTASVAPFELNLFIFGLEERLEKEVELNVYRITQELLNNIIKYAEPEEVSISVTRHEDSLNVMVEDDGKGFDVEEAQARGGLGFRNIETRLNKIGGSWHIDSEPGLGTTVSMDVPIV